MNLDNLNQSQKEYVEDILENFETLNFKNYNDLNFNSTKTKNIDLIIGQDEFITLSLLTKKEDLKELNIISIFEPNENILPNSFYNNFNSSFIMVFSDIRKDIDKKLENNEFSIEIHNLLSELEIKKEDFDNLIKYVKNNKDKKFVINCHAGISRSAAIAYILEDILNENIENKNFEQDKILKHWRYSPNPIVINKYLSFQNKNFIKIEDNEEDLENIF